MKITQWVKGIFFVGIFLFVTSYIILTNHQVLAQRPTKECTKVSIDTNRLKQSLIAENTPYTDSDCVKSYTASEYQKEVTGKYSKTYPHLWFFQIARNTAVPTSLVTQFKDAGCKLKDEDGDNLSFLCGQPKITLKVLQSPKSHLVAEVMCSNGGEKCINDLENQTSEQEQRRQYTGAYDRRVLPAGKWMYGNPPNVPDEAMENEGCTQENLSDTPQEDMQWVCNSPSIEPHWTTTIDVGVSEEEAAMQCARQMNLNTSQKSEYEGTIRGRV